MFSSQLFFFVAISHISEHLQAQPSTTPSPDAWKPYAKNALALIASSLKSMKDLQGAPGNASLFGAEQSILAALSKTDHTEISAELTTAFNLNIHALSELKAACPKVPEAQIAHCNVVCKAVELAEKQLFNAIFKLH